MNMTKMKSTKRALIMSGLSLLLCVSMLIGSTYAWFTDSVVSGGNVITSGNLDIEVQYTLDGDNWADLNGAEDLFQKGLWEPGHTEVLALKIENKGSLALKYVANMNVVEEIIGKNKEGGDIVLSDILTVHTLTQQAGQVGDIALMLAYANENAGGLWNAATATNFKAPNIVDGEKELLPGEAHYTFIKVDMAETVGNEANHDGVNVPSIEFGINVFATQFTYESDTFGNQYDKDAKTAIIVKNQEEAQAVLDELESDSIIQLLPGVNYGTLEVRANVGAEAKKPVILSGNTEAVDYFTTKYPTGEFVRNFENITIIGAKGATVDAIDFVGGTFKATDADGKTTGTMYRFVKVKNFVVDGVEFTDDTPVTSDGGNTYSPLLFDLCDTEVDGVTVKNCTLNGANSKINFVYAYGNTMKDCTFEATLKNVTVANNTVSGIARLCELREANNVTIKNNKVSNLTKELVLFAYNAGKAYSGDVQVIGNTADNVATAYTSSGRNALVVRVGAGGTANIVVKDNVITNTNPISVDDFVVVTDHTGTLTVENNTLN